MNDIEIRMFEDELCFELKMVFMRKTGFDREVYNFYTGKSKTVKMSEPIPDEYILKIPFALKDDLLISMANLLDKKNIKTDSNAKVEGLLNATKYHLEDMRKLVFKERS